MCRDVPTHEPKYTELNVRPGGRYVIEIPMHKEGFTYRGKGVFQEVKPPEKLVFSWAWERVPAGKGAPEVLQEKESLVTVELFERRNLTEMVFRHVGFTTVREREEHQRGWDGCFKKLVQFLGA